METALKAKTAAELELYTRKAALSGQAEKYTPPPFRDAVVQFSDLLQNMFAFVAGSAWTDVVTWFFPSIGADPSVLTIVVNVLVGSFLMTAGVSWLILTGNKSGLDADEAADRSSVERYFVYNSMCFFVGWTWNIVFRDIYAPFGVAVDAALQYLEGALGFELPAGVGEQATVIIFVPLLTALVFYGEDTIMKRYERRAHATVVENEEVTGKSAKRIVKKASAGGELLEAGARPSDAPEESVDAALAFVAEGSTTLVRAVCTCQLDIVGEKLANAAQNEVKAVTDFVDGAVLFVLSKSFSDLIGAFIFGLYPIPFCGDFTGVACTAEADSTSQFYYAGGLLLFAALLKHLAESSTRLQSLPGIESVPAMVSMIGPWAVGAAFNKVRFSG